LPQQDPQGLVGHKFALEAACGRELDAIASTNKQDACYPLWAWHYATSLPKKLKKKKNRMELAFAHPHA